MYSVMLRLGYIRSNKNIIAIWRISFLFFKNGVMERKDIVIHFKQGVESPPKT